MKCKNKCIYNNISTETQKVRKKKIIFVNNTRKQLAHIGGERNWGSRYLAIKNEFTKE